MSRETAVAEALAAHARMAWSCGCAGWTFQPQTRDYGNHDVIREHRAHVAAAVLAALDGLPATPDDGAVRALDVFTIDIGDARAVQSLIEAMDVTFDADLCEPRDDWDEAVPLMQVALRAALAAGPADTGATDGSR